MANNNVIGKSNSTPWHLPADLSWFKRKTINKPIIMGRRTFESIGRPLAHRYNIVISRQPMSIRSQYQSDLTWVNSLESALNAATANGADEVMIIGGSQVYQQALPLANRLYLTRIYSAIDGDTFFPDYLQYKWHSVFEQYHQANKKNPYPYQFTILHRI